MKMKDDLLSALGLALNRYAPGTFIDTFRYYADKDGFECLEIEFIDGSRRGVNITGLSVANILRRLADVIESKEVLLKK